MGDSFGRLGSHPEYPGSIIGSGQAQEVSLAENHEKILSELAEFGTREESKGFLKLFHVTSSDCRIKYPY